MLFDFSAFCPLAKAIASIIKLLAMPNSFWLFAGKSCPYKEEQ
jgi:hypothetical protein